MDYYSFCDPEEWKAELTYSWLTRGGHFMHKVATVQPYRAMARVEVLYTYSLTLWYR